MDITVLIMLILSIVSIIVGLALSSNGSHSGLTSMNGQDLELFKKTKDRGLVKLLQIIFYIVILASLTTLIVVLCK